MTLNKRDAESSDCMPLLAAITCGAFDSDGVAGKCKCQAGYNGTVAYNATSVTGGCDGHLPSPPVLTQLAET